MIAYADNATLVDVRTSVITSGVIPDTYLIEPTGTYWDSKNATTAYNFLKSWIESKDESIPSSLFQNKVNRALFNTAMLLEGRADSIHQITALVTAKERALGTYNESGYLKKYHDYIINNHNIPNTANGIDTALSQALGNMTPLAGEITSVANRAASIAGIPNGLLESDFEYWIDVEITTYCKLDNGANHADCAPGAGNQTDIVSGESHTVPASWYWRAYSCLSSFRGESYGAVCSGIKTGSSSSNFHIDIGTTTVAGQGIVSKLTVKNAPAGTSATTQITVNAGKMENHPKSITTGTGGKFDVIGTWIAYTDATHPCYTSDGYPDVWCIPAVTWTFSGKSTINIGGHGGSIVIQPRKTIQHDPDITSTAPTTGYIGHEYNYDVNASDGNTNNVLTYSVTKFIKKSDDMKEIRGYVMDPDTGELTCESSCYMMDSKTGELTWDIPRVENTGDYDYTGTYDITVKVEDGTRKSDNTIRSDTQSFELTVRENFIPTLEVTVTGGIEDNSIHPDDFNPADSTLQTDNVRIMWRFGGTLPHLGDPIRYDFSGKDGDAIHNDQTFILSVSEEPLVAHAALTDCKPVSELTAYGTGSEIINSMDSPFSGFACIFAFDTGDSDLIYSNYGVKYGQVSDHFLVQLSDGVADPISREISFSFADPIQEVEEFTIINIKSLINIKDAATARVAPVAKNIIDYFIDSFKEQFEEVFTKITFEVLATIVDNFDEHFTLILRCETNVLLPGQEKKCDPLPDDVAELKEFLKSVGIIEGNDVSGQSETREPRWTLVANISNTRHIAINDTNIEPGKVYTYVARIIAGDKASDYMPLGNVTTPADGPPVLILNQPNMTVLLGSPYVDPGYVAVDYYEGNVTDRVRTWTITPVDTSKETSYRIFYYASDSVGNQAPTQARTVTVVAQDLPPTITFIDGAEITVPASVPYVEPGYAAIDAIDGNVTDSVTVTGLVNTDVPGTYMLQYSASDSVGNTATQNRTVIVADMTPPTITLIGGARVPTALSVPYVDPGYAAIDVIDGNVTGMVVVTGTVDTSTEGAYILQYDVSDSAGNAAMTQNRTVIVTSDMTPPVITLKGHPRIEVAAGIPYVDPGYTAIDDVDGNITSSVVVTGLVNTDVLHAYMLHYDVSDSSGNTAITQNRVVSVVDMTPPVFTLIGGTHITVPASVPYVDPGYTAIDNIYGNVTHRVAVSGTVNTDLLGSYTLVYFPDDPSGNLADPVRRTVIVADLTPPVITLKGDSELQITKGTTYVEPGYNATDNIDGNVTSSVVVTGTVDTSMAGTYTVQYDVTDGAGNAATTQSRTVTVMGDDTPPTITLKGQQAITIEGHTTYVEPGYVATDDIDGNITGSVVVTGTVNTAVLDTYTLNYDVSDSSGNAAITQNRTITVVDTTPPVITLKGGSELQITKGTTYVEPGYNATDNIDGNITGMVVVTGTVDTSTAGTYTISYDVTDGAGNVATKVLTVTVVLDTVTPIITLSDGSSITLPMGPTFTEPGYMATDNIDGNITSMVNVTGTVNPLIPGTYTISYEVTDSSGNTGQQTRTVTISPPTDTTQYCNDMTLAQLMASGKYNIINKMFSSESNIKGTDGADLIIVGNNGPTIEGRGGDDCIIGGTGSDTILGQSGNDMIFGNDGDDTIRGGPGHDHLWGQGGNDTMHGGENGDTMYGGADADTMYGGPGQDTIRGGSGNDQIWGLGGSDTIYGDAGDDMLYAGPGMDTIYGGPGTDTIESGESDTIHDDE